MNKGVGTVPPLDATKTEGCTMNGMGFDVMKGLKELWTVDELAAGWPPGGEDEMTPRIVASGWEVEPVIREGTAEVIGFVTVKKLDGGPLEAFQIPARLVYATFFPTREQAVTTFFRRRIEDRVNGMRSVLDLTVEEIKSDLFEVWRTFQEGE